jgi:MFS family permease
MVLPFLTLYLTLGQGLSAGTAGLTLTVYGIAAIIVAPLSGRLSDRLGGLRIMKLSLVLSGLVLFIFPFVRSLTGILALTGLWALTNEAFRPPSMAVIGDLAGPGQRKAAFALTRLAINLGMSIGPVVGGFLAMRSFNLLFYVDGATALLAGGLLAVLPWRTHFQEDETPFGGDSAGLPSASEVEAAARRVPLYSTILKNRRFICFLAAMIPVELVFFQSLAAMPLFLVRDLKMTEAGFGMLLAINTVIIILVEVPLNTAMADWSHRHALTLGALLVGIGFGGLILVNGVFGAAITVVIWTFGEMILLPASAAYVSDIAPREQSGAYMGLYTMGFSVSLAIGPWLGTQALESRGPAAVWIGAFCCGCATAMMTWYLPEREKLT